MQRVWSEREEKKAGKMAKVGKAERERERAIITVFVVANMALLWFFCTPSCIR